MHVSRWSSVPFAVYAVVVLVYTGVAIHQSASHCAAYPQCAAFAHQINLKDSGCPCISLVDRHLISNFTEWMDLPDYTADLTALSSRGYLQTIQITNRQLLTLPDAMQHSTQIQEL